MQRPHRRETLFIDTNLLLVLLVGALDLDQVDRFKRTRAYSREDYALLTAFVGEFRRMLTTPNVLTEVSNLLGQSRSRSVGAHYLPLACLLESSRKSTCRA